MTFPASLLWFLSVFLFCTGLSAADNLTYFSDAEGNWEKVQNFFKGNPNFTLGSDGLYHLKPGATFVFGGDASDRGEGSLRIRAELLRMKKESPARVVLIAGNRDINKVRIAGELGQNPTPENLKAILKDTMGAPNAFEFHRAEMALLKPPTPPASSYTDQQVVDHFLEHYRPNGPFAEYLSQTQLAYREGNTLFVHSSVSQKNFGQVPGTAEPFTTVEKWLPALNGWYESNVKAWRTSGGKGDAGAAALKSLVDYGGIVNPLSVVNGRSHDRENNPQLPADSLIDALLAEGIHRLVVGHTPIGQVAVILRRGKNFEFVGLDNSYAKGEVNPIRLTLSGPLLAKLKIENHPADIPGFTAPLIIETEIGVETRIGRRLANGHVVLAEVNGKVLSFLWLPGKQASYLLVSAADCEGISGLSPTRPPPVIPN